MYMCGLSCSVFRNMLHLMTLADSKYKSSTLVGFRYPVTDRHACVSSLFSILNHKLLWYECQTPDVLITRMTKMFSQLFNFKASLDQHIVHPWFIPQLEVGPDSKIQILNGSLNAK